MKDLPDKGRHGDFVFYWEGTGKARKKCLIVSISVLQVHMGLTQSLNLWQNLCLCKAVEKGGGGAGGGSPPTISWSKNCFSHVKLENLKFLHVNNMLDFSLFIEQDISDKK